MTTLNVEASTITLINYMLTNVLENLRYPSNIIYILSLKKSQQIITYISYTAMHTLMWAPCV